jgi:filamentous hemagglutinin
MGGHQGGDGVMGLFGVTIAYQKGSLFDKIAESYAGTHDKFNSFIWYDKRGNAKKLDGTATGMVGDLTNWTNVGVATPFALSTLLPPEVWNAIATSINASK